MTFDDPLLRRLTVHVAGADYLTGVGLAQLLGAAAFIEVTGFSTSGREAVERVKLEEPDIVLMDALISGAGHAETTSDISQLGCGTKVVVLSAAARGAAGDLMEAAFEAGAASFLVTDTTLEDVAAALRIVHRGGFVSAVAPRPRKNLEAQPGVDPATMVRFDSLGARDLEIVRALAEGQTNLQISRRMHLSEATVKARLARVMQQFGFENRVQVAVAAIDAGIRSRPPLYAARGSVSRALVQVRNAPSAMAPVTANAH